ncbi:MAG: PKD domain-containing protein, partial [Lacibacter sp.]
EKNPVHLYTTPGQYNVCLTIRYANANCEKTYCSIVTVPPACDFQPYFSWTADAANPLTIKFTNQTAVTSATAKIKWSFGDGTSSADWNPTHTYTKAGVYNVCIRVELSPNCVKEICKQVVVRSCDIEAGFTWVLDSVLPMRGVKFYPLPSVLTVMPLSIKWSFGDGTSSAEYSPFHQYQQPGTYKVCMRIEFFAGCVKEVCKDVVIPAPVGCEQLSLFKIERISAEPNTFVFNAEFNNSTLKYTWTFGDGTGAIGPNAKHKYDRPGRYNVCLTVYRGDNCASTTCKEIVVGQLSCEQTFVKFEYQRLNSAGNVIKFKAVSNQPLLSQYWTIYKSNSTVPVIINAVDPTYTFQDTGWYKVCLRAITVNGCVKEYCEAIRIQQVPSVCTLQIMPNPVTTTANFKVQVETPQVVIASIIDITGVRKAVFYLNATAGINAFAIPTGTLPTGYYTLEVKIGNRVCTGRFQKIN